MTRITELTLPIKLKTMIFWKLSVIEKYIEQSKKQTEIRLTE